MPEDTLREAVRELHAVVMALKELIAREYPRREEIEQNFINKKLGNVRWIILLLILPVGFLISSLVTISTVSTCFLEEAPTPGLCRIIPHYQEAMNRNNEVLLEFERLRAVTEENRLRILELENEK